MSDDLMKEIRAELEQEIKEVADEMKREEKVSEAHFDVYWEPEGGLPKSEEFLKDLARRCIKGEIFVAATEESIRCAFMMFVSLGADFPEDTVALYGDMKDTFPRSMNGYPIFSRAGYLRKEEFPIFHKHYTQFDEFLNG